MVLGKISHLCFTVVNIEQQEKFLNKLGFALIKRFEHKDKSISLEFTSPAGDFIFQLNQPRQEHAKDSFECSTESSLCFDHIAFKVDDINKEFEELKNKGIAFTTDNPEYNPKTGRIKANLLDEEGRFWIQLSDL